MSEKTYIPDGEQAPESQIGATLEALSATIVSRRSAGEESYTFRLLDGPVDAPLKKIMEEAGEVALAAKDADVAQFVSLQAAYEEPESAETAVLQAEAEDTVDHLRYEAADVVYHLLVVLERFGISIDEFAAELNARMTDEERPAGGIMLNEEHIQRGK